jgi:ABC-type multidrug transport system fused ATPase/permease subunit
LLILENASFAWGGACEPEHRNRKDKAQEGQSPRNRKDKAREGQSPRNRKDKAQEGQSPRNRAVSAQGEHSGGECGSAAGLSAAPGATFSIYPAAVSGVTFSVYPGDLLMVAGAVGAGKSSMLSGILGEALLISGSVDSSGAGDRVAYCSQNAWVQNLSVRDNILFGKDMEEDWYNRVLAGCALESDLFLLPHGDGTIIGERGVTLSGGQKQRVALARAVGPERRQWALGLGTAAGSFGAAGWTANMAWEWTCCVR